MGKAWPALDIHVPSCDPQLQELVLAELDDFQPTAIQEPDDTRGSAHFSRSSDSRDAAARALGAAFGSAPVRRVARCRDEDWAARSQAQLRAITIGRIVVAPPWDDGVRKRGREGFSPVVTEDPPDPFRRHPPVHGVWHGPPCHDPFDAEGAAGPASRQCTVLDIGCGSGVLAIAAVKLGAQSAVGIDIDPDALENARENAGLNSMGEQRAIRRGRLPRDAAEPTS